MGKSPLALIVIAAMGAACGSGGSGGAHSAPSTPTTHTLSGRLVAPECGSGWEIENSQVELENQNHSIIGTANTSANLIAPLTKPCVVSFSIPHVPDAKFYTLTIGSHGGPAWSHAELVREHFQTDLNLGGATVPAVDHVAFCTAGDRLNTLMFNTDLMNHHAATFESEYKPYVDTLQEQAAALILSGNQSDGADLAAIASALAKIESDGGPGGLHSAGDLNKALALANNEMPHLMVDCPGVWNYIHYS